MRRKLSILECFRFKSCSAFPGQKSHLSFLSSGNTLRKAQLWTTSKTCKEPSQQALQRHLVIFKRYFSLPAKIKQSMRRILLRDRNILNMDDKLAILIWILLINGMFLFFGTTGFVSCILWIASFFSTEEAIKEKVQNYLKKWTGFNITIEKIAPNWKDSSITVNNVHIHTPPTESTGSEQDTVYSLLVNRVEVTLSFIRFLEGKGLIHTCSVSGVRGTIDRQKVHMFAPKFKYQHQLGDFEFENFLLKDLSIFVHYPPSYRSYELTIMNASLPQLRKQWVLCDILKADFISGSFDHCLFTLTTPSIQSTKETNGTIVHTMEPYERMRHFKMDGVKIDHINANSLGPLSWVTRGSLDLNAILLFPSNKKRSALLLTKLTQTLSDLRENIIINILEESEHSGPSSLFWPVSGSSRENNISHSTYENDFFEAFQSILRDPVDDFELDAVTFERIIKKVVKWLDSDLLSPTINKISKQDKDKQHPSGLLHSLKPHNKEIAHKFLEAPQDQLSVYLDIKLRNIRACLPFYTENMSLVNNTLVKPIVGYINEHRPGIPLSCFFNLKINENFDGAWTPYDGSITDAISSELYKEFTQLIAEEKRNIKIYKRIGWWSLQAFSKNLLHIYDLLADFTF